MGLILALSLSVTCSGVQMPLFLPLQAQDPQMLDQLSKNITRCGLSNSTLNYLRVSVWSPQLCPGFSPLSCMFLPNSLIHPLVYRQLCVILEPMQELMSRHKTYSLSPRDCLKTCLFQKWQRMVAPPGECLAPALTRL